MQEAVTVSIDPQSSKKEVAREKTEAVEAIPFAKRIQETKGSSPGGIDELRQRNPSRCHGYG